MRHRPAGREVGAALSLTMVSHVVCPADSSPFSLTSYISDATSSVFSSNSYVTTDPNAACLFVVVLGEVETKAGGE